MSISTQTDRTGPFIITGLPQVVPVTFPFQAGSELIVYDTGASGTTNDPAITLTLNSDYTVAGGGYDSSNAMQTGSITVVSTGANNVQVGDYLVIARNVPINQTTSFQASGPLTIQQVEQALDKQATLSQQVNEVATRALRFEAWEFLDGTLLKSSRAGKLLGFDTDGNISFSTDSTGSGGAYTAGPGLALSSNEFSVLPDQTFDNLTVANPIVADLAGNADTATALETPRTINGVTFDGTANITVPAAASTLTGTTLASNVVASSLTSVAAGTIGTMAIQNANAVAITGGTLNGATVTGLANGTNPTDAVNLSQLQGVSAGIILRTGVVAATTANISLTAPQTIDGQAVIAGNRVLVKNQTAPAENGIYVVAAGAWTRATDSDTVGELLVGYTYFVSSGTTQGASTWSINVAPATINVSPVGFVQFSASQAYAAGTGLTLTGNVFSLNATQTGLTINGSAFNGTVGASTPSTGAFTTTTTTGNAYMASLVIKANQLNEQATNGTASVLVNYDGYAGGTTQFRDLGVYDGKNNQIFGIVGSTKAASFAGNVTVGPGSGVAIARINGGTAAAAGPYLELQRGGTPKGYVGLESGIIGNNSDDTIIYGNPNNVKIYAGGSGLVGTFNANGLALTGYLSVNSNANIRTTKGNFNIIVNVKDYGALGDGATNDTAAIASAVTAAISAHGVVYFPASSAAYISDPITVTGAAGLTVCGDGMGVSIVKRRVANSSGGILNVSSSNHVNVYGLTFDGNCSTRTAGGQAVVFDAVQSSFHDNEIINSGEYAFFAGSGATEIYNLNVQRNYVHACYADGINFQYVTRSLIEGNIVDGSDDDCIALGYNGSGVSAYVNVIGNFCRARNDLGTNWGRGILAERVTDCLIEGNVIDTIKQTGILIDSDSGTRPARVHVIGNTVRNTATSSGHGIAAYVTTDCEIINNVIVNPAQGSGIELADWQGLTVEGNSITNNNAGFGRGIHCDEAAGWAASWDNLRLCNNSINITVNASSNCIYLNPDASTTMNTIVLTGNTGRQVVAGDYITIGAARCGTKAVVANNVTLTVGRTINVTSGGVFAVTNNL